MYWQVNEKVELVKLCKTPNICTVYVYIPVKDLHPLPLWEGNCHVLSKAHSLLTPGHTRRTHTTQV